MEIAPGIHQLHVPIPDNPLGHLNCYLIQGTDGWTMVDTGWYTPDAFDALQEGLRGLGISLNDVSNMIVTHAHPDHYGLAGKIKQKTRKARLLTHRWESDMIESRYVKFNEVRDMMLIMLRRHGVPEKDALELESASMPAIDFVTVTFPDVVLYGGEIISTGRYDLEVIWTPGHSPGHICLYEPSQKLLFTGDHILPTISPNVSYHVQSGDDPLGDFLHAMKKLQHLPVSKALPAHEDIFTDLRGRIAGIFRHHEARKGEILKAIAASPSNAYEISAHITWNLPQPWDKFPVLHKRIAVTETVAHLENMRWEGRVERIAGKVILYRAIARA